MEGKTPPGLRPLAILLVALSLSLGWGVRGNWGHEFGAMIPGALAAMAACLVSGRESWRRRIAYFAFFGAVGWSFGGSISYMMVIGYTHSGHLPSVVYGFACLFVIGFCWGAMGGAGTALPAYLDRARLTEFFPPLLAIFGAWIVQDFIQLALYAHLGEAQYETGFAWYDTDWMAALSAMIALGMLALVRRRWCQASGVCLYAAIGWWLGFLIFVNVLGLHMTPPRGDNWAGALGMTLGLIACFVRRGWRPVTFATLVCGLVGGFGFSFGQFLKLMEMRTGWDTNWHSTLEQSYGFINGLGAALALGFMARIVPDPDAGADPALRSERRWTGPFAFLFVMLLVTWLSINKNIESIWLPNKVVPAEMHGISIHVWFNVAYLMVSAVLIELTLRNRDQPLALLPENALGRGQLFYLFFLWWIVLGNLSRYLPFQPQRLITEGTVHLNACICSILVIILPLKRETHPLPGEFDWRRLNVKLALAGLALLAVSAPAQTWIVKMVYGEVHIRHASEHIRFGPHNTNDLHRGRPDRAGSAPGTLK